MEQPVGCFMVSQGHSSLQEKAHCTVTLCSAYMCAHGPSVTDQLRHRRLQDYLCRRAEKHFIPKVDNTNVDRSVAAIHATVLGCLRQQGRVSSHLLSLQGSTEATVLGFHQDYISLQLGNKQRPLSMPQSSAACTSRSGGDTSISRRHYADVPVTQRQLLVFMKPGALWAWTHQSMAVAQRQETTCCVACCTCCCCRGGPCLTPAH